MGGEKEWEEMRSYQEEQELNWSRKEGKIIRIWKKRRKRKKKSVSWGPQQLKYSLSIVQSQCFEMPSLDERLFVSPIIELF